MQKVQKLTKICINQLNVKKEYIMKILRETPEEMIKFDTKFTKKEEKALLNYANNNILKDKEALLNYAVNKILLERVNSLKRNIKQLKEAKKHEKGCQKGSSKDLEKDSKKVGYRPVNSNYK